MRRRCTPLQRLTLAYQQKYQCARCHELLPPSFELDHIVPLHQGGSSHWRSNLQCLCANCHRAKTTEEVLQIIEVQQFHEVRTIHRERRLPTGERQWLVEWEGQPKRSQWTWETAYQLEQCDVWREWIAAHPADEAADAVRPERKRKRRKRC